MTTAETTTTTTKPISITRFPRDVLAVLKQIAHDAGKSNSDASAVLHAAEEFAKSNRPK